VSASFARADASAARTQRAVRSFGRPCGGNGDTRLGKALTCLRTPKGFASVMDTSGFGGMTPPRVRPEDALQKPMKRLRVGELGPV